MYAYHCEMFIYFLEDITDKVRPARENDHGNNHTYINQEAALTDVEKAEDFIGQLNHNGKVVGIVFLIFALNAINSTISLLKTGNTFTQEVALVVRSFQWICLTMFTIYEASRVTDALNTLSKTGLAMYRPPVLFTGNDNVQNKLVHRHTNPIILKVKLFGIPICSFFPYVIIILILFSIMVGAADFKWYEQVF